jgi:NAD(P)-dependent dehydrogenase (short-subunit alcohol dehydrogenase family)
VADLSGKVGVVTGGNSGIGRAAARALARAGAALVIGGRNASTGEEVVREIRRDGGRAVFQGADVARAEEVRALVERAVSEFGRLDLAFNNAGTEGRPAPLHEQDVEAAASLLDVNVKGVFFGMKYQVEQMLKTGGGAIVNNSSVFGLGGFAGWSLYVASKHAVTGMTKAAALDYARSGIRVNAVGPGPIETPLLARGAGGDPHAFARGVPMGRIGQPDEVAAAVVWLCSDEASFVTGVTIPIDGGFVAR